MGKKCADQPRRTVQRSESICSRRRRGAAAPAVALCILMLLGCAALTVDSGRLYVVRGELQNTADAAALAAARALLSVDAQTDNIPQIWSDGYTYASTIGAMFVCAGKPVTVEEGYVTFGRLDTPDNLSEPLNVGSLDYNAVRVFVRRSDGSPDGPISLTFSKLFGNSEADVSASAVAHLDDHMSGYRPPVDGSGGALIPMTVEETIFEEQAINGDDRFAWNEEGHTVESSGDGVPEIVLFPYKLSADGVPEGDGNFGILNIGVDNQGEPPVARQITDGVTQQDLISEIGTPEIEFVTDDGSPQTHVVGGNPGLTASLKTPLDMRVGTVIGFFLHRNPVDFSGSNALYTLVGIRFGRVMYVKIIGQHKEVVVQPIHYEGPGVLTDPSAPGTDLYASQLRLVR
jgi:Flp pilus assembly protein TadG